MIYPLDTDPKSVNTAMIRIADENNKDIDLMKNEIARMRENQTEIEDRYKTQVSRWERYRTAYEATLNSYNVQNGNMTIEKIIELFPWNKL